MASRKMLLDERGRQTERFLFTGERPAIGTMERPDFPLEPREFIGQSISRSHWLERADQRTVRKEAKSPAVRMGKTR